MTIEEILFPITVPEFIDNYLGKQFCLIKGTKGKFSSVFNWNSINQILNTQRLEYPRLRLVQRGQKIEQELYQSKVISRRGAINPVISHSKLGDFVRSGATLIIDAVNEMDLSVNKFAEEFENTFSENVQANAYIALSDNQGFVLHWDSHDVFVVQISGKKEWKIYSQTRKFPMHNDIDKNLTPPEIPIWEGIIEDGDFLYLPRGWWHEAKPLNDETIHLSMGINHRTGIDILEWLKGKLSNYETFRKDIPKIENSAIISEHEKILKENLLNELSNGFVSRFLEDTNASVIPKSNNISFPFIADPRTTSLPTNIKFRIPVKRKFVLHNEQDKFYFKALNKVWTFSSKVKPIIETMIKEKDFTIEELIKTHRNIITDEQTNKFVLQLLQQGLIVSGE